MRGKPRKCTVRGQVRWYVDAADPSTGKRKRTLFGTETAAEVYQAEVNRRPKPTRTLHALVDPDVTLEALAADWLCTKASVSTRPGTIGAYRQSLMRICGFRLGAQQTLGALRVRELTVGHAEALVTGMRRDDFAPRTTAMAYRLFSTLLDRAVRRGLLPQHPVDRGFYKDEILPHLSVPKDAEIKAFTEDEGRRFLKAASEHSRLADLYAVGFLTGCRIGELLGLQLGDDQTALVDGRRVRQRCISRSLNRGSTTRATAGPTKSGKNRTIDVGIDLGALLDRLAADRLKQALRYRWRPVPSWLFVTRTGQPFDRASVRRDFDRVLRLAGLGETGFTAHSMRHSFASWHIMRGRNAKWVQQQLGHASISITLDLYADWFKLHDEHAADELGSALLGNGAGDNR
jgi:integrase